MIVLANVHYVCCNAVNKVSLSSRPVLVGKVVIATVVVVVIIAVVIVIIG